ncbi:McrB family protein [Pseudomonas shahriarae]|uniref:McrB family protein n=1 Tax=Pseudomonas shahriarae TaxID=2745512 RepID=UPI00236056E2|nr:AAA family ATPase [Pseudomonas shahriarae]MDD0981874.1 AAA family ATPase [Pseudomonas shahriarae]
MSLSTNDNFTRLVVYLEGQGSVATQRTENSQEYRDFLTAYPPGRLSQLTLDDYCVGKGDNASFCWWVEQGLVSVLGRYMPGTAKGHILYFQPDGSLYKNRHLVELSDEEALRYTLKIQSTIAAAEPESWGDVHGDLSWVDDDKLIYQRAGVEPRVTVGDGRKLRLLSCYYPSRTLPISSSDHLRHYLLALGCTKQDIPHAKQPVARMLKLREYYQLACESVPGLSPYGFMRGLYSEEMRLAPDRDREEGDTPALPTYLLSLGPAPLSIWNDGYREGELSDISVGDELTLFCNAATREIGDTVYLIRSFEEPRGIVAKGVITRTLQVKTEAEDRLKPTNRICCRIDELRPTCAGSLLPLLLLKKAIAHQKWDDQTSGIKLSESVVPTLNLLWQAGVGKHSLRQYIEWSSADGNESRPKWLKSYRAITQWASTLSDGKSELDQTALERLWLERDNGVSSLKQGVLSRNELNAQRERVAEMTQSIMAAPTAETFKRVLEQWKVGVQAGDFSKNRPAMISRVFATFSPDRYTSLLKTEACQSLIAGLASHFQLINDAVSGQDWCSLNQQIKALMASAGVDETPVLENNIAMWQLLETLQGDQLSDSDDSTQGTAEMTHLDIPLNQILFGPPGTGKTYATINHALQILDPAVLAGSVGSDVEMRRRLKLRFDELIVEGRIRFVTFHQSFSYEDFIEGLRASTDNGQIRYHPEDGVFKKICADAAAISGVPTLDELLQQFVERAAEEPLTLETSRGKRFSVEHRYGNTTLSCIPEASLSARELPANIEHVRQLLHGVRPSDIYCESYVRGIADHIKAGLPQSAQKTSSNRTRKPYVLIIDEINRGNVSRIFGELITLIEPSKRQGANECLPVELPYSRESFSVPDNLYIIGTMNTADRSLAGLDIALRRRFTFTEMLPQPDLLDGVLVEGLDVGQLLRVINQRIEVLLDRDHCLGHAYFIPLLEDRSLERLELIFRNQVLPLLQEYFFEDWQRIQWVLNDHRKPPVDRFVVRYKQDLISLFGSSVPAQDQVWRINVPAFKQITAYVGVIAVKTETNLQDEELEELGA